MPQADVSITSPYYLFRLNTEANTQIEIVQDSPAGVAAITITATVRSRTGKHYADYTCPRVYKTIKGAKKAADKIFIKLFNKWEPIIKRERELDL